MTEPDSMVDVYRRLALALEPDLEERPLVWSAALLERTDLDLVAVRNDRGLLVTSRTSLGAWTAALEACQRRAAWRTMKAKRKLERLRAESSVTLCRGRHAWDDDDQPDGAA